MDEVAPWNERWMRGRHARTHPLFAFLLVSGLMGLAVGLAAIIAYVII